MRDDFEDWVLAPVLDPRTCPTFEEWLDHRRARPIPPVLGSRRIYAPVRYVDKTVNGVPVERILVNGLLALRAAAAFQPDRARQQMAKEDRREPN